MTTTLLGPNPVLTRELRASLRNARAFGLIALYVALLGAVVVAQFPGDMSLDLQSGGDGGKKGHELFMWFIGGQAILILLMLPALATGALAQERERQTLEPLLLSPMTPLQIVWGKAGGVLSLVCLLLISTLPLTSLCFLLGGVTPGELVGYYAALLGLAVFTTGLGLYCSARWPGATRAMIYCYLLLPPAIGLLAVFLPLGSLLSGFFVLFMLCVGIANGWKKGRETGLGKRLGQAYPLTLLLLIPACIWLFVNGFWTVANFGYLLFFLAFILSYLVLAAQYGMLQTARELMQRPDPEAPMRQKFQDFKEDWSRAVAPQPIYLPDPRLTTPQSAPAPEAPPAGTTSSFAPEAAAPVISAAPASPAVAVSVPVEKPKSASKTGKETYGKVPFLSDNMNPVYARELRSGLLGKFEYLFRLCYGVTIISELGLLGILLLGLVNSDYLTIDFEGYFNQWAVIHLGSVMIFGAWFGARAIAPEREGQTLIQLFTIPLPAFEIIKGKTMAVLTFTLYVWILAVPLALLMGILHLIPWQSAFQFVVVEAVMGFVAASWGVYCSFHGVTVRRALSLALGGTAVLLLSHSLAYPLWSVLRALKLVSDNSGADRIIQLFPVSMLLPRRQTDMPYYLASGASYAQAFTLTLVLCLVYTALAVLMLFFTARDFRKYAQSV